MLEETTLYLDVATRKTGYAVFVGLRLDQYGLLRGHSIEWSTRCEEITRKFKSLRVDVGPDSMTLEYPTFQAGTKGMAAARSGGTLELAYLCGMLVEAGYGLRSSLVPFRTWAGQVTKEMTCRRVNRRFGLMADYRTSDNDWADAIAMGAWALKAAVPGRRERKDY